MIWIEKISFKNYKVHRDAEFEFCRGTNAIMGPSDRGKSTIIGGIHKLYTNRPAGTKFITHGETHCEIRAIQCDDRDGTLAPEDAVRIQVVRKISKTGVNEISILDMDDNEIESATKFGQAYPPDILKHFPFKPTPLGYKSEILNFSRQFDGPFLLSRTPREIGIAIGKLAGTEVLDVMYQDIGKDLKSVNSEIDNERTGLKSAVERTYEKLEEFDFIPEKEAMLSSARAVYERMAEKDKRLSQLTHSRSLVQSSASSMEAARDQMSESEGYEKIIDLGECLSNDWSRYQLFKKSRSRVATASKNLEIVSEDIRRFSTGDKILKIGDEMKSTHAEMAPIVMLSNKIRSCMDDLQRSSKEVVSQKRIDKLASVEMISEDSIEKRRELDDVIKVRKRLSNILAIIESASNDAKIKKQMLQESVQDYQDALERLPDAHCPICRSDISGMNLADVSREMFA